MVVLIVLICLSVIVVFRLAGVDSKRSNVWNPDEAISACAANSINVGGLPYRDSVDHRGPLTYYIYSVIFKVAGRNNMVAIHWVLTAIVVALALLVFAIGRYSWGQGAGLTALAVFTLLSCVGADGLDLLAFHTEWPLLVCTTTAMLLVIVSLRTRRRGLLFAAGFFFGCAFLSKQVAAADLVAAMVYVLLFGSAVRAHWRHMGASFALVITGAAIPVLAVVGWFALHGALADFWFYFWTYNTDFYMRPVTATMQIGGLPDMWHYFSKRGMLPVIVLGLFGISAAARDLYSVLRKIGDRLPNEVVLFAGWLVTAWLGASISTRGFGHYYIAVLAPLSLLAAHSLLRLWTFALKPKPDGPLDDTQEPPQFSLNLRTVTAAGALSLSVVYSAILIAAGFSPEGGGWGNPYLAVSRHIAAGSTKDDLIFVWGFVPEIYVQSDRMHASRYTFCNQVTGLIIVKDVQKPYTSDIAVPGAFEIMMDELTTNRPLFIVDTSIGKTVWDYWKYPFSKFPPLDEFVRESYREVGVHIDPDGSPRLRLFRRMD